MIANNAWKKPIVWLMLGGVGLLALALFVVSLTLDNIYFGGEVVDLADKPLVAPAPPPREPALRLAVATMFSPTHTYTHYIEMADMIGLAVGLESTLIIRPSYQDLREVMSPNNIDVALVCTGPFALMKRDHQVELLVQPVLREGLTYHSALIVPAASTATNLGDLRGKTIAYSDQESHTGSFVLRYELDRRGFKPDSYFDKILYTGSHDRSIEAVEGGFVDGAAVHSLILDGMMRRNPELPSKIRVIWRSEPFGPPPVVVPIGLDPDLRERLHTAFLHFHETQKGRKILDELGIQRFIDPRPADYSAVLKMYAESAALLPRRTPGS